MNAQPEAGQPAVIRLQDYRPPAFEVDDLHLHFELDPGNTLVTATSRIRRVNEAADTLVLDGQDMKLLSVAIDGEELPPSAWLVDSESLTLNGVPDEFELRITTSIDPDGNTALEGLYRSSGIFCTQCEAEGFRKITYFPDRPDVMTRYTTTIVADSKLCPVMLSNGNLVEHVMMEDGRHRVVWQDPFRKPSYLFALVAGDLACIEDRFTTRSGREIDLRIYVERENIDKCGHAMASLKKAMKWDEDTYGLEYDLDTYMIVAVNDFNMGAMENKGLNIFNSKYVLARADTATDCDYEGIESVIAHEYFHNWTGNRVTCRDWFQLSLKEGLTVYRDQEFSADMNSRPVCRIKDVRVLRSTQFPEDAGPMAHPVRPESYVEINNFYTATVYNKGAEVVRMYETLLGKAGFRKGMDLYFERHDGQAVTTDDFLAAMADANGADLAQFARWYSQAGTPVVDVSMSHDAGKRQLILDIRQSCPPTPGQSDKLPFLIPFAIGFIGRDGKPVPVKLCNGEHADDTLVLRITDSEHRFVFEDIVEAPILSLNRGFSAPIKTEHDYSDEDLAILMAHDTDPFNRWEAMQLLATRIMLVLVETHQRDGVMTLPSLFIDSVARLFDAEHDDALLAESLHLPGENYLAEHMEVVDVDAIHAAREFMHAELARRLRDILLDRYMARKDIDALAHDARTIGARSLKNICLHYLVRLDESAVHELCLAQFRQAGNMTDEIAALDALVNSSAPGRMLALQDFHNKWKHDPLVMDKWFSLQATSRMPDVLDRVADLLKHPEFDIRNPNKVRALIGAFSHANPRHFHAVSGRGYVMLADLIIELDPLNPQVAARLLGAFSRWRRYDERRRTLMRLQLQRILDTHGLSRDCYEIASKSLQDD